nr:PAS domain-containing protein [Uliginosibacterium gangwonense]
MQSTKRELSFWKGSFDVLPYAAAMLDENSIVVARNPAFARLLGDEPLPTSLFARLNTTALREFEFEDWLKSATGQAAYLRFRLQALPAPSRQCLLCVEDLTASKRLQEDLEARLQRSRAMLWDALEVVPAPTYIKDAQGRYLWVNESFCLDRNQSRDEILGLSAKELFVDRNRVPLTMQEDLEVIAGRRVYKQEEYHSPVTNKTHYRVISKAAIVDEDNQRVVFGVNLEAARWNLDYHVLRRIAEEDAHAQTSRVLAQSTARARAYVQRLIDVIPQPVYIKDAQSRYVMVNDALAASLGRGKEEVVGQHFRALSPDDAFGHTTQEEDREVLSGKVIFKEECKPHPQTGAMRYRQISKARCEDIDGVPVIVCASFDLTPQRMSERGLQEALTREVQRREMTQSFIQRLIDVIPEPVYVKDASSTLLMINDAFAKEYGVERQAAIGADSASILSPMRDAGVMIKEDADVLGGCSIYKEECVRSPISGADVYLIIAKGACLDADGRPVIVGTHFNVSLWREAEHRAMRAFELQRRTYDFLQSIFNSVPNPLFVCDAELRYLMVNRAYLDAVEQPVEAVIGHLTEDFLSPEIVARSGDEGQWLREAQDGDVHEREITFNSHHGAKRWFMVRQVCTRGIEDQRIVLGMASEITCLREAETRWFQAKEAAEKANAAKTEFLANMSHELRTPMHAILSFARIGQERASVESVARLRGYFSRIVSSGERLMGLLDSLLDISKLESGRMTLRFDKVDLVHVLDEVLAEFEALLAARQLRVARYIEGTSVVRGDGLLLGQVIRNLLSNAVKYSPPEAQMDIRMAPYLKVEGDVQHHMLEFAVADRGVGIPEGEQDLIFEKFVQSSLTRSGAGGTGLGLAICKEIVALHGGEIFACCRLGGGAEFVVRLQAG